MKYSPFILNTSTNTLQQLFEDKKRLQWGWPEYPIGIYQFIFRFGAAQLLFPDESLPIATNSIKQFKPN